MRRRLIFLLGLLLAGAAVWLLLRPERDGSEGGPLERAAEGVDGSPRTIALPGSGASEALAPSLVGRPAEAPATSQARGVAITVVGPGGQRLPFAIVRVRHEASEEEWTGFTDENGVARFPFVPLDGRATARAMDAEGPPKPWHGRATIDAPEITLRTRFGVALDVRFLDAESGTPLDPEIVERGFLRVVRAWDGQLVAFSPPDDVETIAFGVAPPPGWVCWEAPQHRFAQGLYTQRLVAHQPLRREAEVRVTVLDHRGRPERTAYVASFLLAGREAKPGGVDEIGAGRYRVRGIPFFRGEPFQVGVSAPTLRAAYYGAAVLGAHPADAVDVLVRLPSPDAESPVLHVEPKGGTVQTFRGGHTDFFISKRGSIRVKVLRQNGEPAAGATVWHLGRRHVLDANGEVRIPTAGLGENVVAVSGAGLLPSRGTVDVVEGEETLLTLTEPRGATLDVRVVDEEGRGLPFATLMVKGPSQRPWIDEEEGVQRIDPFTDETGRRLLQRVEAGSVKIAATWASREGTATVEVENGGETTVEIVAVRAR